MALQLLLGAATTQEWHGHSLFKIASKPLCPFCYHIDGWVANPWVHLLAHCQRVGTAIDCTHYHATAEFSEFWAWRALYMLSVEELLSY